MTMRLGMIRMLAFGTAVIGATSLQAGPAAAQGAVCAYGPSDYRACCKQSYARNPRMSASARAEDIEACMDRGADRPKGGQQQQQQQQDDEDEDE